MIAPYNTNNDERHCSSNRNPSVTFDSGPLKFLFDVILSYSTNVPNSKDTLSSRLHLKKQNYPGKKIAGSGSQNGALNRSRHRCEAQLQQSVLSGLVSDQD